MKFRALALLCGLAAAGWASPAAAQQDGCYGYPGYYHGYHLYGLDHVPYYALHPPVYYSFPVPRTYGYSPFAYPPYVMTPEVVPAEMQPATLRNPYVPRDAVPVPTARQTTHAPVRIRNPFFGADGSSERLAERP